MANPLAGKFATAFDPSASATSFAVPFNYTTPLNFETLLNKSQAQTAQPVDRFEELIASLSPEKQAELRAQRASSQIETEATRAALEGFKPKDYTLDELRQYREAEMRTAQELGKESLREAAKYSMLTSIPKTISEAYSNMAAMQLAAAERIPATYADVFRSMPKPQLQATSVSPVTQRYYR